MKLKNTLFVLTIMLLAGIFVFSAYQVGSYLLESRTRKDLYDDLAAKVEQAKKEIPMEQPQKPDEPEDSTEPTELTILPEYEQMYVENADLVGWISIADTKVNYPVMQSPQEKNFYLHKDFYKNYNLGGCIYAQETCDVFTPSDNIIIYGHNMKDGTMFHSLSQYLDVEFWKTHQQITFDTIYERHTYQIFAVFKTSASDDNGFQYQKFVDCYDDEKAFDRYVCTCKDLAFYETDITPVYGDKMICLSTCEYTLRDGRLVVAAVRVA